MSDMSDMHTNADLTWAPRAVLGGINQIRTLPVERSSSNAGTRRTASVCFMAATARRS